MNNENPEWFDKLLCFGPKRKNANILINNSSYDLGHFCEKFEIKDGNDNNVLISNGIQTGFQLATASGPLCAEPMEGIAFIIDEITVDDESIMGNLQGQAISTFKDICLATFQLSRQRIKEQMYKCEVKSPTECIGKVFQVLDKRRAKVLEETYDENQNLSVIDAILPVSESFGFTKDIVSHTSGAAFCQLNFYKFITMEEDPFWVPTTKDELEEYGEKADIKNIAKIAIDNTRRRKGLLTDEKIVEFVDKQSTRSKKK